MYKHHQVTHTKLIFNNTKIHDVLVSITNGFSKLLHKIFSPLTNIRNYNLCKNLHTNEINNHVSVNIVGIVDWKNCNKIKNILFKIIQQNKSIYINTSQLQQLNSFTIAILLEVINYARYNGTGCYFGVMNNHIQKVLDLNNVDEIFRLEFIKDHG